MSAELARIERLNREIIAMLALGKIQQVERLLAEGKLSQRQIAKMLGISRATIRAIATGQRPDYEARREIHQQSDEPQGPIERCATCGGRVYMPCRLCRVRTTQAMEDARLKELRRRARQQAVKRLLAAVLRAANSP